LGKFATLLELMTPSQRRSLWWLCLLMFVSALAELVTIGSVVPFLSFAAASDTASNGQVWRLSLGLHSDPVVSATFLFVLAYSFAAALRIGLLWSVQRFSETFGHDLAARVFSRSIRQDYLTHTQRNSSDVVSAIIKVQVVVLGLFQPLLEGVVSGFIAALIAGLMFTIAPVPTMIGAAVAGAVYLAVHMATRQKTISNSMALNSMTTARTQIVQETLGSMRETILGRIYNLHEARFNAFDRDYRAANRSNAMIAGLPRHLIEVTGIWLMGVFVLLMANSGSGLSAVLPTIGAIAVGALRLLPLLQSVWRGSKMSEGHYENLLHVAALAEQAVDTDDDPKNASAAPSLTFKDRITLQEVSFRYPDGDWALSDVTLEIAKGEHICICGETGSGKSTLLDLLLGLLLPQRGEFRADGAPLNKTNVAAWQATLAHVPQTVFLIDDTIEANVVFGLKNERVDRDRLRTALAAAQLLPMIDKLPDGVNTKVGERGVRLSGGERQRIGIARAIYRDAPILILDEATSSLDSKTEAAVMDAIAATMPSATIISVAHRAAALAKCDRIITLNDGRVFEQDPIIEAQ